MDDQIKEIIESEEVQAEFAAACTNGRASLTQDPEWVFDQDQWTCPSDVVAAFVYSTIVSSGWFIGYQVPANFEKVINDLAKAIEAKWGDLIPTMQVFEVSLCDLLVFYERFIESSSECKAWEEIGGETIISAFSPVPTKPQFISMDVLARNAVLHIRDQRRKHAEFDRKFEEKYGHLES